MVDPLNNKSSSKERKDCLLKRGITITGVYDEHLEEHASIFVMAVKDGKEYLVGELMIHKNSVIYKADLIFVSVYTQPSSGPSNISPPEDVAWYLKYMAFNQALIRTNVATRTVFDLNKLKNIKKVKNFIDVTKGGVPSMKALHNLNDKDARDKLFDFIKTELIEIYELYGKHKPPNNMLISDDRNPMTYVFNTDLTLGGTNGFAHAEITVNNIKWGNSVVIFKQANLKNDTLIHEIGHSFRLPHVFQVGYKNKHEFYQGFSNKVMDYTWHSGLTSGQNITNPNLPRRLFTRYQWYLMHADTSTHPYL